MTRFLIDTDVILDYLLDRGEFADSAASIWDANSKGDFEGFISAITPVNIFYISRKAKGLLFAQELINELLEQWRVCPVDEAVLKSALTSPMRDFEDAVQHAGAKLLQLDGIVTRNIDDYQSATLPVLLPVDFLATLSSRSE